MVEVLPRSKPQQREMVRLSAQGPACVLWANLLQASKKTAVWGRIHKSREVEAPHRC